MEPLATQQHSVSFVGNGLGFGGDASSSCDALNSEKVGSLLLVDEWTCRGHNQLGNSETRGTEPVSTFFAPDVQT